MGACALRLRSASRRRYLPFIRDAFPQLATRYENTYHASSYAAETYRRGLNAFMVRACEARGLRMREYRYGELEDESAGSPPPPPTFEQLELNLPRFRAEKEAHLAG